MTSMRVFGRYRLTHVVVVSVSVFFLFCQWSIERERERKSVIQSQSKAINRLCTRVLVFYEDALVYGTQPALST